MATTKGPLDRDSWAQAALDEIERGGVAGLAVAPLARSLGVTKGSFYWHFGSREELLEAALERWERQHTSELLSSLDEISDPRARLAQLFRHSIQQMRPTVFARLVAATDEPLVAATVERTTRRRLEFLERAYRELGLTRARARRQARLAYASYIGFAMLGSDVFGSRRSLAAQAAHAVEMLVERAAE